MGRVWGAREALWGRCDLVCSGPLGTEIREKWNKWGCITGAEALPVIPSLGSVLTEHIFWLFLSTTFIE